MGKKLIAMLLALGMCFSLTACEDLLGSLGLGIGNSSESTQESSSLDESTSENKPSDSSDQTPDSGDNNQPGGGNEDETEETVTVTFKQEGQADIIKILTKGTALTDIPAPVSKTGYTVSWDVTDFASVTEDMVVNAIETGKTYTVTFEGNIGSLAQQTIEVQYGETYQLPQALSGEEGMFKGWLYNGQMVATQGVWEMDSESGAFVLTAKWISAWTGSY